MPPFFPTHPKAIVTLKAWRSQKGPVEWWVAETPGEVRERLAHPDDDGLITLNVVKGMEPHELHTRPDNVMVVEDYS